jgi:hypothetical protein
MSPKSLLRPSRPAIAAAALILAAPASRPEAADAHARKESVGASARLRADVAFLADDAREGRAPGTRGIEAAADYIADQFKKAGLEPAPGADGYFQPFTVQGGMRLTDAAELALAGPGDKRLKAKPEQTFISLSNRGGTVKDAPVVFAGYGITADDEERKLKYDDYDGIDAKGKAVLILRGEPQEDDPDSPFDGKRKTEYAQFLAKVRNASKHGAAAVLLVNNAAGLVGGKDLLLDDGDAGRLPLPTVMLTRDFADDLLSAAGQPGLKELEEGIDAKLAPRSHALEGWTLDAEIALGRPRIPTKNVVGVLEGAGPLADETIVVGAHYDHVGRGGLLSGSLAPGSRDIHNGADDNASGTAMVIEMARRLAARPDPLPRRIVFIAFSGEEKGLLGSAHYVGHPLFPLKETVAMINFDMVGRLNDKREVIVYGTGTSPGLSPLVEALGQSQGLDVKRTAGPRDFFGASDHYSFYRKDIPVLFFFTGNHPDYHRPSDDTERINFAGMARLADVGELILLDLARRPSRPAFTRINTQQQPRGASRGGGSGAYLGTIPSYADSGDGVKLDGVNEGSPAEKGGLRAGDVIVRFGDTKVEDINDFMDGLTKHKPGDEVEVVVRRDGKETPLKVKLGTRPGGSDRD